MRLLQYKNLDLSRVESAFAKVRAAIETDDFKRADIKKLHTGEYFRAKLAPGVGTTVRGGPRTGKRSSAWK